LSPDRRVKPRYDEAYAAFDWAQVLEALGWRGGEPVNLGHTLVDRHAGGHGVALYWFGKAGDVATSTFRDLSRLSSQFAHLLRALGVAKGDRVATYMPRVPETLVALLGAWKAGAICVPIFTAFGTEGLRYRVQHSGARVVCTYWEHRHRVPNLGDDVTILTVGGPRGAGVARGDVSFWQAMRDQPDAFVPEPCRRDEVAAILYTSGSTGQPKGVMVANNLAAANFPYMRYAVDLRPTDVFWTTADPGWGYGLVCHAVTLAMGLPVTMHEATPTPELCLSMLRDHRVTNFATIAGIMRGIVALGRDTVARAGVRLRCLNSVGEPLDAETLRFCQDVWGLVAMDQYGATELALPIGNLQAVKMDVKPGSMGLAVPGFEMAVLDDDDQPVPPGQTGRIGMRQSRDGFYALGYWDDPERTRQFRSRAWIVVDDAARRDEDGYFWFEGRADDVIKSSGYRIGPVEVENAIARHAAVLETAVVGKPDKERGQIVKAYVVPKPGVTPSPALEAEIVELVKSQLGKHQYPREIEFVPELPKGETGKIQRFKLRPA
jgi:acetyl-CoA synthetase